jgi:plastocyanin
MRACTSLACLILAACGGSSSPANPDAAPMADAAPPSVTTLMSCPPGDMPTVMTIDTVDAYMPATTTISAHGIVKFVMSLAHNVAPNRPNPTDPGLMVDYGKMACLVFDKAGTFSFRCSTHFFVGTIVVE